MFHQVSIRLQSGLGLLLIAGMFVFTLTAGCSKKPDSKQAKGKKESQTQGSTAGKESAKGSGDSKEEQPSSSENGKKPDSSPETNNSGEKQSAKGDHEKSEPVINSGDKSEIEKNAAAADKEKIPAEGESPQKVILGSEEILKGIPGDGELTKEQIQAWLDNPANHEVLEFDLPLGINTGLGLVKGLDANPLTRAKIELGRQLYFDARLSADSTVSCASCHQPNAGFAAHTKFGVGIRSQTGGRNSPVAYNRILSAVQFWDGRAATLEEQAKGPIQNPIEMGNTHEDCVETIKGIEGYAMQFKKIFGEVNIDRVAEAIASFERCIVTGPSPFDYGEVLRPFKDLDKQELEDDEELLAEYKSALAAAEAHPMSESAARGRELFFSMKTNCTACHAGANLTDELYHNLGVGMDQAEPDVGRFAVTKEDKDVGAFKTPTIRNVALTAPYMHDGSQATLEEVVDWYAKGGHPNPHLSPRIKKLDLTDQDKKDLVEFMKACTGDFPLINTGRLPE